MKLAGRMQPRTRLFIMCAVVMAMVPIMLMANRRGEEGAAATFLDSVAESLRHEPRVEVLHVDPSGGQILILNKVNNQKLTFALSRSATPPAPAATAPENWLFTWKDEAGKEVAKGRIYGSPSKSVYVMVPGLN
jgi:hypothetical protein